MKRTVRRFPYIVFKHHQICNLEAVVAEPQADGARGTKWSSNRTGQGVQRHMEIYCSNNKGLGSVISNH